MLKKFIVILVIGLLVLLAVTLVVSSASAGKVKWDLKNGGCITIYSSTLKAKVSVTVTNESTVNEVKVYFDKKSVTVKRENSTTATGRFAKVKICLKEGKKANGTYKVVYLNNGIVLTSTQMVPAAEQKFAKGVLLKGFTDETGIKAEFIPMEYHELFTRLSAEIAAQKVTISLVGDLHGGLDLMNAKGLFDDLAGITLPDRTFIKALEDYSVIAGRKVYVPWMQATYVMVVNKKAFEYLPAGLKTEDITGASAKWTYDALLDWSKNLNDAFKGPKLGFPMGPKGLWHRFLHGYIYPSFTGYQAKTFDSAEAVALWEYLRKLVSYIHPASSVWEAMDEPLLKEEILVAWDHTARVKSALIEKPEDFAIVPVPCGPQGRGYITVAVGLAIPVDAPQKDNAIKLIDHLTKPEVQVKILENVGFFPTVKEAEGAIPVGPLKILATGVLAQSGAADSVMVMIPSLGAKGGEFTATYRDVFTKIVVEGADIGTTITEAADKLRAIFKEVGVPLL